MGATNPLAGYASFCLHPSLFFFFFPSHLRRDSDCVAYSSSAASPWASVVDRQGHEPVGTFEVAAVISLGCVSLLTLTSCQRADGTSDSSVGFILCVCLEKQTTAKTRQGKRVDGDSIRVVFILSGANRAAFSQLSQQRAGGEKTRHALNIGRHVAVNCSTQF